MNYSFSDCELLIPPEVNEKQTKDGIILPKLKPEVRVSSPEDFNSMLTDALEAGKGNQEPQMVRVQTSSC